MIHDGWMLVAISQTAKTGLMMAAPLLGILLIAGIVMGVIQVASQLSDMSVAFVPKTILFILVLFLMGGGITGVYLQFYQHFYKEIPNWVQHH